MTSRVTTTITRTNGEQATVVEVIVVSTGSNGGIRTAIATSFASTITSNPSSPASDTPASSNSPGGAGGGQTPALSSSAGSGGAEGSGPTNIPASDDSSSGVSTAAVAGAAVGCLIGGALIAFLLAFFIFKRREQKKYNSGAYYQRHGSSESSSQNRDVIAMTEKPSAKSGGTVTGWQAFLPQSADDRTIQNGVKTFFNLIELHVDNFYRKTPVEFDSTTKEALSQIDSGKLPGSIDELMEDQRLLLPVIKHCIADLLITRMSPLTYPETSLLPSNLSAIPTKLQSSSLPSNEKTAASQAYSQWRLLNAYLYPHPEQDAVYVDDREAKANDISEILASAFAPWQTAGDKTEMHTHEKGLVATAGNLGILLMSQPSAFEFKWTADAGRPTSGRSLITLPAFWKSTDEQGRQLAQPQLLVSPSIVRV